jgi:hypothetical protein
VRITSLGATADGLGFGRAYVELCARKGMLTRLTGQIRPLGFEAPGAELERAVRVEAGTNRFDVGFYLPQVRPWWDCDRGEQPLYELTLCCGGVEEAVRFGARLQLPGEGVTVRNEFEFTVGYPRRRGP